MWKIGDLELDGRVILGPMAGFTSRGYREFMEPFGVAASVTEMTSDMGIIYGTERTEESFVSFKSERPTGLQLFGHDPECLAKAAIRALELNPNIAFFDDSSHSQTYCQLRAFPLTVPAPGNTLCPQ